jgi:hypothetical protein
MYWWMEAYGTNDAQLQVQQFSSTKYKSHRHIPDTVARSSTEVLQPLWLCAKLGLLENYFSLSFYTKKNPLGDQFIIWGAAFLQEEINP